MYDEPSLRELVGAVKRFLQEAAMPALEGRVSFHARVAANALSIVERQLDAGADAETEAHARLRGLLGRDGSYDDLEAELCARIRSGELGLDSPGLGDHLRATALAKLAVDQPHYAGYRRAVERPDGS